MSKVRKLLNILMMLSFSFSLVACDKKIEEAPEKEVIETEKQEEQVKEEKKEKEEKEDKSKETREMFRSLDVRRQIKSAPEYQGIKQYDYLDNLSYLDLDLSENKDLAYSMAFNSKIKFKKMPSGFDKEELVNFGKAPGLNVDILHKHGFTGKGAVIAYIDQAFSSHKEYQNADIIYKNLSEKENSMHGPAVISLLAGKDIGTAPDAKIYYYAHKPSNDQAVLADAIYKMLEDNKKLEDKIKIVGFSNNILDYKPNSNKLVEAVKKASDEGVMIFFCGDYRAGSFIPLSDKNNPNNLIDAKYSNYSDSVCVPAGGRTYANNKIPNSYTYDPCGGVSWTMPYVLGLYASAVTIDPSLTKDDLLSLLKSTSSKVNDKNVINPVEFIATVLDRVDRNEEAKVLRDEVKERSKYLYAIINYDKLNKEDLSSIYTYLQNITDSEVILVDASKVSNAKELLDCLKEDHLTRKGEVSGIQIFGDIDLVPSFKILNEIQMADKVHKYGSFYTDLFYSNFSNDTKEINSSYSIYKHFNDKLKLNLVPSHKVVRLPLKSGEFKNYFDKYLTYFNQNGTNPNTLVNFSSPIFDSKVNKDDMGYFLDRMAREFKVLDIPYKLYANKKGDYPVTNKVLGDFTRDNIKKESSLGINEFIINGHGQENNTDRCYYINGEEKRESFVNSDNINELLADNYYYLDTWTCKNGKDMKDNLTCTALRGKALGVFSCTTIISNNGVSNQKSLEELRNCNFYYFYYVYLKELREGKSRSDAFFIAEQEFARAVLDNVDKMIPAYYESNLNNLLCYHNFGVIEPNKLGLTLKVNETLANSESKYNKHDIDKKEEKPTFLKNSFKIDIKNEKKEIVKSFTSVKKSDNLDFVKRNDISNVEIIKYDDGSIDYNFNTSFLDNVTVSLFNPPKGDVFMFREHAIGENIYNYHISKEELAKIHEITLKIHDDNHHFFICFNTSELN